MTMEMCSWKMGQQRKRNKALNRMRPATKTTTPEKELTGVTKGQTRQGSPTKDIPKKTKNRSREHKKHRKNSNGDRRKMTQHLYRW
jgi:hypothetical protein